MYGGLSVYTGNAHPTFARDICRALEIPLGAAEVFKFANDVNVDQTTEIARMQRMLVSIIFPSPAS